MQLKDIQQIMDGFIRNSPLNVVTELQGMRIYETPLLAVAAADDPLFEDLKDETVVGAGHLSPQEWLPGGRNVLSYFLPFTETVRAANRAAGLPAREWLYGRIEGQVCNEALSRQLVDELIKSGFNAVAPALDSRLTVVKRRSNWSERHVAFVAGLGTVSLNASLITKQGAAGRLGSIITDLPLPSTPRYYTAIDENCSRCGACIRRCPPRAIDAAGKDHAICSDYLDEMRERFKPRYGCGKCQTAVPCESRIPPKVSRVGRNE